MSSIEENLVKAIMAQQKMMDLNRTSIQVLTSSIEHITVELIDLRKEISKCSKQQSSQQ